MTQYAINQIYARAARYAGAVLLILCGLGLISTAMASTVATAEEASVTAVTVEGEIRAGTTEFVRRAVAEAEAAEHELFLLEIDTPGGLLRATEDISRQLIDSDIPTAVFAHQDAGQAFSAGVYILLSANTAASHPTASLGAAAPLMGDGGDADEKTRNATESWIRSLAERNDRDPEEIATLVTENRTYNGREALEAGVIDMVVDDRATLLAELGLASAAVYEPQPTVVDSTLSFFSIPYLVPLLLTLGSLGLFLAARTGEIEVTGAVSLLVLLLGLWGSGMIALSALGVTLLVVGIGLIALELFLGGADFGISGVIGLVALLFGVALFAQEPLFPDVFSYGFFPVILAIFVSGAAVLFAISYFTASAIRQPHATGVETLRGREATVHKELAPEGVIMLDGERYSARLATATDAVAAGERVIIEQMEGNVAIVRSAVQ